MGTYYPRGELPVIWTAVGGGKLSRFAISGTLEPQPSGVNRPLDLNGNLPLSSSLLLSLGNDDDILSLLCTSTTLFIYGANEGRRQKSARLRLRRGYLRRPQLLSDRPLIFHG